ncbi:MAG: hypothetical protein ACFFAS_09565 [Promethearchaeota archaeon]
MKKYIDFDKLDEKVYINYFLEDYKLSIKVPLEDLNHPEDKIKIAKFQINHSVYLTEF